MEIRGYKESDKKAVQDICLYCDGYEEFSENTKIFLLSTYCDYYTEREPENCFVAADDNDNAVGYILSTGNYDSFSYIFRNEYLPRIPEEDKTNRGYAVSSLVLPEKYKTEYPAHLHIDILGEYQRMGLGHRLMDALLEHLKNKGISGVMLSVNPDNAKGMAFYKKYGFEIIEELPDAAVFGMKL